MITSLDIVDTAVKIGLGALITGVATYAINVKSFKQELKKRMLESNVSIIKETAIQLEQATNLINTTAHFMCHSLDVNDPNSLAEVNSYVKCVIDAFNTITSARVKCAMLGERELAAEIGRLAHLTHEMYEYFNSNRTSVDVERANQITNKMTDARGRISKLYEQAYRNAFA